MQKNIKIGCGIAAGLGCLCSIITVILLVALAWLLYIPLYSSRDTNQTNSSEVIGPNGVSQGFAIDPNTTAQDNDYSYQIGAYLRQVQQFPDQPRFKVNLDYTKMAPLTNPSATGSLWVGTVLDNNYFIQVGMMTSNQTDSDGSMQWNFFWEMWDDQNTYVAGLMKPMSSYGWNTNASNTFMMMCTNPSTGEWEFKVNDKVVGQTFTKSCALSEGDTYLFWELTTPQAHSESTTNNQLPTFGPFKLHDFEYWDGTTWLDVPSARLAYSYGPVSTSTQYDQVDVCPPYGAGADDLHDFIVGSTLDCELAGSLLWQSASTAE